VPILENSSARSEKAMISVGHTKVLKKSINYFIYSPNEINVQVKWVEEEHHVFALVVGQRHGLEVRVDDGIGNEVGGRLADLGAARGHFGSWLKLLMLMGFMVLLVVVIVMPIR
jgi:hypothetical protein